MIEMLAANLDVDKAANKLFYYQNTTNRIQIIRVAQAIPRPFEKAVFPGERVLFYSRLEAVLDVYHSTTAGLVVVDRVSCSQLQVLETDR
ncbi:MAG TPA: DUF1830 domain-containing protein [Coleofasciculaceae cyanobacterium]